VATRSYGQYCAVAYALDALGDRWALLVIRELLGGPRRYTDLRDGLPGISTDLLAARLRDLEAAELVRRRALPPPAASTVYELTEDGAAIEPLVIELARWGVRRLPTEPEGEFRCHWIGVWLRSEFVAAAAEEVNLMVDFVVDEDRFRACIDHGTLTFDEHPAGQADIVLTGDAGAITRLGSPDLETRAAVLKRGQVTVDGEPRAIAALARALGLMPAH